MEINNNNQPSSSQSKQHPLLDLAISIVIPSVILMKLSGEEQLGAVYALILALAFPLGWGAFELVRFRKWNLIAIVGLVSIVLTGGIGLLHIETKWLAVKEAVVPGVIGLAIAISARLRHPFVRSLIYNPAAFNVETIRARLNERNNHARFEACLQRSTYLFGGTFFFSSAMNYLLAKALVKSPAGTQAFNEELGRLTLVSYPAIALPSMVLLLILIIYLWRTIRKLTGLSLEEIVAIKGKAQADT